MILTKSHAFAFFWVPMRALELALLLLALLLPPSPLLSDALRAPSGTADSFEPPGS